MTTYAVVPNAEQSNNKLYEVGTGVISGTTQIDGVAASCRVRLEYYNDPTDIVLSAADGTYTFTGLLAGKWQLIVESLDGARRAKTEMLNIT